MSKAPHNNLVMAMIQFVMTTSVNLLSTIPEMLFLYFTSDLFCYTYVVNKLVFNNKTE